MQIKMEIRGIEAVQKFLKSLPRGTIRIALDAMAEYFLGNERRGLRHNPKRVQHGPDNPYQWQSEKQRRAYFATNGFGKGIPYPRSGKLADSWYKQEQKQGYAMLIGNKAEYADYVQGFQQQRGHWADGWRKARDIIFTNMRGAMLEANRAVSRWLAERNK